MGHMSPDGTPRLPHASEIPEPLTFPLPTCDNAGHDYRHITNIDGTLVRVLCDECGREWATAEYPPATHHPDGRGRIDDV